MYKLQKENTWSSTSMTSFTQWITQCHSCHVIFYLSWQRDNSYLLEIINGKKCFSLKIFKWKVAIRSIWNSEKQVFEKWSNLGYTDTIIIGGFKACPSFLDGCCRRMVHKMLKPANQYAATLLQSHMYRSYCYFITWLRLVCLKIDGAEGKILTKTTNFSLGDVINISCEVDGVPAVSEVVWIFNNKSIPKSECQ